jgi:hypothetical protein
MTYSYSESSEKLRTWLEQHADDGSLNSKPIIEDSPTELKGYVHERDYNDALKFSAPWAGKKAFIADQGIVTFASRGNILTPTQIAELPTYRQGQPGSRLFRGRVTQGMLSILKEEFAVWGISDLNTSQQTTVVLRNFIANSTIIRVYQGWVRKWMQESSLSQDEVETVIYDFYRVDGARKRYQLVQAGDPDAQSPKML